jgi:signal transduction histidine kinase
VRAELCDKQLQVAVIDNGFGMEERQLEKLFTKFFRIKKQLPSFIFM